MIQAGLEQFEGLYRRRKYNDAMTLGEDLLKLSPKELKAKHGFSTEEFDALAEEANKLVEQINIRQKENNGWLHPIIEMKLAMLRRKITSSPDEWSTDFLDDSRSEIAQITGEYEFCEDFENDDGGTAENYSLTIGSNTFIPGFEDGVIGMAKDEEKDLTEKSEISENVLIQWGIDSEEALEKALSNRLFAN